MRAKRNKGGKPIGEANSEITPSRSQKKRDSAALQKLGEALTQLAPADRLTLNLNPELLEALELHDRIKDHEGARRQRQFIGKLMRAADAEEIASALARMRDGKAARVAIFQAAERWRDKMVAAREEELDALVAEFRASLDRDRIPAAEDLAQIRAVASQAHAEKEKGAKSTGAGRELFRLLAKLSG